MADIRVELNKLFAIPPATEVERDVMLELQSILRLQSIDPEQLSHKWEAYAISMGVDSAKMDLPIVRAFKKDLQELLEKDAKGKSNAKSVEKRRAFATPRAGKETNFFGNLNGVSPSTPQQSSSGGAKRRNNFETPSLSKAGKHTGRSSPTDGRSGPMAKATESKAVPFADRPNPGQIIETLNEHLQSFETPIAPPSGPRMKLTAASDLKKFSYKPMAMHQSEASEVLDDRLDEFQAIIQSHYDFEDSAFGSAASQSTSEVVAIGRVASDTQEGKLNAASLLLETSRRNGAGIRIPLKVEGISHAFFPGQVVAVKGINASGEYFAVQEILEVPPLPPTASLPSTIDAFNEKLGIMEEEEPAPSQALGTLISSGPYTADDNLDYEPLHALCEKAKDISSDMMVLIGPFLDMEHPLIASGDFELPDDPGLEPDKATLTDAFRLLVGKPLSELARAVPSITIVLIPSVRDAVNKHVCWPQANFVKAELGLPKQAKLVTNPVNIAANENVIGISSQDILYDLRREEALVGKPKEANLLARLSGHLISQRHFYPLYPPVNRETLPKTGADDSVATGTPMDISYLKLGDWFISSPDMLLTPSSLPPFTRIVNGVVVINPGPLSKRKGAGTYAQLTVYPRKVQNEERQAESSKGEHIANELYKRARVDITRI